MRRTKSNEDNIHIFLDSGAFSAFTQKDAIDLDEYIDFVKEHKDKLEVYVVLDVIGDAEASWRNQAKMEKAGLRPLPVYHIGEPLRYLQRCIDGYEYFCIGTTAVSVGGGMNTRVPFVDRCFSIICDTPDRMPKAKVHGLGMMHPDFIWKYPWYSVDASTWKLNTGYGIIFVPSRHRPDGTWIYDKNYGVVMISERATWRGREALRKIGVTGTRGAVVRTHVEALPAPRRRAIMEYLEEKGYRVGRSSFKAVPADYELQEDESWCIPKDPKYPDRQRVVEKIEERGVGNDFYWRLAANLDFVVEVERSVPPWPWPFREGRSRKEHTLGLIP